MIDEYTVKRTFATSKYWGGSVKMLETLEVISIADCIASSLQPKFSFSWYIGWCKTRILHPILIEFNLFLK